MMATVDSVTRNAQAGKYLTFGLAGQEYGLGILKVQEIHSLTGLARTPDLPGFLQGAIDLRGRMVPVINLRERFGLPPVEKNEKTCIVVIQAEYDESVVNLGIVVDEVEEVLALREDQIEAVAGAAADESVMGTGRLADRDVTLLDADGLLNRRELESVAGLIPAVRSNEYSDDR
ncbi:purine-binding chemotaxis protein CheW [bacterium]|nr:purine-binding chemotaxis protein CheW [bacterium]